MVVSLDHWHLGYVGCYGNDWIETPHLDRLASQAVVFDQHFSENIDPAASNHAWWTGRVQFPLDEAGQSSSPTWLDALHANGVSTQLFVESDGRDDTTIAPGFAAIETFRGTDGFDAAEGETPIARTVQHVVRWLRDNPPGPGRALLWIKSRGIPSPWVPPRPFAELYLDEFGLADRGEAPRESESDEPQSIDEGEMRDDGTSPGPASQVDESLDWRYAAAMYAAYATLVDRWLGKLLHTLEASTDWRDSLLVVAAGAGQALGEHGRLADERLPLRAESVHAPLWIKLPASDQGGTRRQALVQTTDIGPTLLDWFVPQDTPSDSPGRVPDEWGQSLIPVVKNETTSVREVAWLGSGRSEWGIRTADFFYVEPGDLDADGESPSARLFEKPHDRWDQFDVVSQFPQVSETFHEMLTRQWRVPGRRSE